MHILLISMYYKPDTAATGLLMAELAEELTELGHEVTVVTSMPHYTTNKIWPEYRRRMLVREKIGKVNVIRTFVYVPADKEKVIGRFASYVMFTLLSAMLASLVRKPDVILTCSPSPPLTNSISAVLASWWRRTPIVFNIQDIYPDVAIRLGLFKSRPIVNTFLGMERFAYKHARAITVLSEGFRTNLIGKAIPDDKIRVIPNFVDANFVRPMARCNAFSQEQSLNDKFVVLFAGNIGMSQGLEVMLDAAKTLAHIPDILFLIVGNGSSKEGLEKKAKEMKLPNVRFLPYQSYSRVPELYSAADVCIIPLKKGLTEDSVPSKLFTIMGVARPVVATVDRHSETYKVIDQSGCGLCADAEDAAGMAASILQLYEDCDLAGQMGRSGRAYVEQHFTRQRVAEQYEELFAGLNKTGKVPASNPQT